MGHARPDTANVRDVLLAEPHRVRFTGRTLLRGPLLQDATVSARPSSTAAAAFIGPSFCWALRMSIIALHLVSVLVSIVNSTTHGAASPISPK
jgi:hypothetical protein